MNEEILDVHHEIKNNKYPSVLKTGVASGILASLSFFVTQYFYIKLFLNSQHYSTQDAGFLGLTVLIAVLIFIIGGMLRIAAWGNRKRHYLKIVASGLICYQLFILFLFLAYLNTYWNDPKTNLSGNISMLGKLLYGNLLIMVFAFIFWLIPGKLPYFRKQVEK